MWIVKPNSEFEHEHVRYRAIPVILGDRRSTKPCANCAGEYDDFLCGSLPDCYPIPMIFVRAVPAFAD